MKLYDWRGLPAGAERTLRLPADDKSMGRCRVGRLSLRGRGGKSKDTDDSHG